MGTKKASKKINLLEMSDSEKIEIIKQLKQSLHMRIVEAKLWQSLTNMENLVINGENIRLENVNLEGLIIGKT